MPYTHIPKYPVVDPDPSLTDARKNFNIRDYLAIVGFATSSFAFSWLGCN
jgi:hypothetical protein